MNFFSRQFAFALVGQTPTGAPRRALAAWFAALAGRARHAAARRRERAGLHALLDLDARTLRDIGAGPELQAVATERSRTRGLRLQMAGLRATSPNTVW